MTTPSPVCPAPVRRSVMWQRWENLVYIHFEVDPEVVRSIVPRGLEVDMWEGKAYVGLIPFQMRGISLPHLPAVPYLGTFPEVNVRTYVIRDGIPGVWFCSLDINRLLPTLVARGAYSLPYCFGQVHHRRRGDTVTTTVSRRWPGRPSGATTTIEVEVGERIDSPTDLEHFLSARWGLYSATRRGTLRYAAVDHEQWPLHRAVLRHLDDGLVAAAGIASTVGEPLVMYSPGVKVRVGLPRRVSLV